MLQNVKWVEKQEMGLQNVKVIAASLSRSYSDSSKTSNIALRPFASNYVENC